MLCYIIMYVMFNVVFERQQLMKKNHCHIGLYSAAADMKDNGVKPHILFSGCQSDPDIVL